MLRTRKVDAKAYYDTLPTLTHACGDIWRSLPTFGLLGSPSCTGMVITPACDLSWQKSDTLTYLPIVPLRAFFSMDAALPTVVERTLLHVQSAGFNDVPEWSAQSYLPPGDEDLDRVKVKLEQFLSTKQRSSKVIASVQKALSGLETLRCIGSSDLTLVHAETLATLFGSEWSKIKERLIINSYSPALHFLPKDNQDDIFSSINHHSLALFRYPITVPVKMLNYAQETSSNDWNHFVEGLGCSGELKSSFGSAHPVKMMSLKSAYLSDLLTRFSALYNRVGSPDFSDMTVTQYSSQVDD